MGISVGSPTLRKQTLKDLISFIIAELQIKFKQKQSCLCD